VVGKPERVPAGSAAPKPSTRRWSYGESAATRRKAGVVYRVDDFQRGMDVRRLPGRRLPLCRFPGKRLRLPGKRQPYPFFILRSDFLPVDAFWSVFVYPVDDFSGSRSAGRRGIGPHRLPGRRFFWSAFSGKRAIVYRVDDGPMLRRALRPALPVPPLRGADAPPGSSFQHLPL